MSSEITPSPGEKYLRDLEIFLDQLRSSADVDLERAMAEFDERGRALVPQIQERLRRDLVQVLSDIADLKTSEKIPFSQLPQWCKTAWDLAELFSAQPDGSIEPMCSSFKFSEELWGGLLSHLDQRHAVKEFVQEHQKNLRTIIKRFSPEQPQAWYAALQSYCEQWNQDTDDVIEALLEEMDMFFSRIC